jgi:radical SAM superfamily enzyme YgiQ (UPF0313 family)
MAPEILIAKTIGPPKQLCRICQTPFWDERQFQRHLIPCYKEHEAELQEANPANVMPTFFGPERGDPELREFIRKHGHM